MNRILLPMLTLALSIAPLLGWAGETNTSQAKAIAEIEKLGGGVTLDEKSTGRPVISVNLCSARITDAGLIHLKGLTQLQSLSLIDTKVTGVGLRNLRG